MEIPGVSTVLVLCDRVDRFYHFFRQKGFDRIEDYSTAFFGQTQYILTSSPRSAGRGLSPESTRYAVLEPFFAIAEALECIAPFFERIFLEENDGASELAEGRRTAAEVVAERQRSRFTGFQSMRFIRRRLVDGLMVEEESVLPQPVEMRVERMVIDDPIAMHDSNEYLEAVARYQQMMTGSMDQIPASAFLGVDRSGQSTPRPPNIYSTWLGESWVRDMELRSAAQIRGIGDTSCANNARDRHLRCAVNPMGPCEGCDHFEATVEANSEAKKPQSIESIDDLYRLLGLMPPSEFRPQAFRDSSGTLRRQGFTTKMIVDALYYLLEQPSPIAIAAHSATSLENIQHSFLGMADSVGLSVRRVSRDAFFVNELSVKFFVYGHGRMPIMTDGRVFVDHAV